MLTVGSLFTGIGGLDLGLERAGMQVRWQVEIDPYCNRVLEKHWPGVKRYGDIKSIVWSEVEPVELICGGFPCQPVSVAGARKGDKDDRWLWPEFLRAICAIRPRYALVENVPGLLSTDNGRLARRVFGDLAEAGYDSEWDCVSAQDVGAPHLRRRVFIVAHAQSDLRSASWDERPFALDWSRTSLGDTLSSGCGRFARRGPRSESEDGYSPLEEGEMEDTDGLRLQKHELRESTISIQSGEMADPDSNRCERQELFIRPRRPREASPIIDRSCSDIPDTECEGLLSEYIPEARPTTRYSGFEQQWAIEPDVGRVANGVPSRVDRLKCLGNAVVPQVAEYIGKPIIEAEEGRYDGNG